MNTYNNFNNNSSTNKILQNINSLFVSKKPILNNNNQSNPFNIGNKNNSNTNNLSNNNFINNEQNKYKNLFYCQNPINNIVSNPIYPIDNNNYDEESLKLNININKELLINNKISLDIGQSPIIGEEQNSNFFEQNSNDYKLIEQLDENKNFSNKEILQKYQIVQKDSKVNIAINKNLKNINNFNIKDEKNKENSNNNKINNYYLQNNVDFNIHNLNPTNGNNNNNKNNGNKNEEKDCNKISISEDLRNHLEQINITEIDPEWFKNENNYQDPSYFEKLKAYELKRMGIKPLKLSDFLIGRKLGSGQFGHVYLAKLKSTQFICAIKVINKNRLLKESLKCINQIRREIEIQSHLHHPNILSIYNFFWDKKNVYLVIEYALGGELFKLLRKEPNGRFSEPKAAFYIKQVCEGIEYIHKMHIIHRDIKPENILVCNEVIKLADFGWSIHQISNKLRKTFCGTAEYMPPEVLFQQPHIPSSDLWCLGVLIFELCSGETPFNGNSNSEIIYKIKKFKMKAFPNYFSEDVKDLIGKLLKRSPNERISIEEVKAHPWITKNAQKYVIK